MELTVIVGGGGLLSMAQTGHYGYYPYHPWVGAEEFGCDILAQAYGDIYRCEPKVARQAVEYSAKARVLLCHAGELSVRGVKRIGPYKQEHACDVEPHVGKIKHYTGSYTEKYGGYGDGVWSNSEAFCQTGPHVAYRSVECEVDMLFGVHRLKGIAVAYLRGRPVGGVVVGHGVHLLVCSLMVVSMHLAI